MDCPATDYSTYQCTFEAGDSCFLSQETLDDFDWTFMQTGETETHYTGPSSAVEGSSYAYIETSSPRLCCDVAILSSHRLTIEGTWGEWANWGPCSQSCGTSTPGTQMRIRPCVTITAHVGGVYCLYPEDHKQTHDCPTISCPVDGGWGGWDSWTPCSVSCGNGTKTRYGVCDNPAPAHNGLSCVGNDTDEKQCTLSECLVDGVWATWRTWSACAFVNTDVRRSRCRRCANPISLDVSASCSGDSLQSEHCPTPDDTFKKTCRCRRRRVPVIKNITKKELATVMEETKKALTVDKTKTSLSIRKKTSAPDDRKSSAAMASVLAVVLLSVPVILIVGIDLMNIRYINVFKRKKSKTSETIGCNDKN
ncbi:adhesion G protein-coupled receptor B1-like isoform X2 [Argopecten irradians]|uniref:adhesion G protein-coupled receptor B1-like isoform X2 n=1 Tax=Argopecten irradians TaxID=31199 RepID=UPI0037118DD2